MRCRRRHGSILQTFALAFPADVTQAATTFNSTIGLRGNLQRMLNRSRTTRVHRSTAVQALKRGRSDWFVETSSGTRGPYRHLVMNAPPHVGRTLMRTVPGFGHLTELLSAYGYFDSRILVHTDPAYVQHDRRNWEVYNAGVGGRQCEGSVWYGALHRKRPSGESIDVFKSWAERRRAEPAADPAATALQTPRISRAKRSKRPRPWVRCKDAAACTSVACTPPGLTRRNRPSTRP